MKKRIIYFFLLLFVQLTFSQNKGSWQGYFSYNEIKAISTTATSVCAASENALFFKNNSTGEIKTTTTVDGLSGQTISSIYHSTKFNETVVGYQTGLIIAINETDGTIKKVVDITNKNIPSNLKRINHFMEWDGILYVSTDFGIVQFNLKTLQFGDTYFIGDNGAQIGINQTAIYKGFIYASTKEKGIRSASITNPNLNDFGQWKSVANDGWIGIETFGNELIAATNYNSLQRFDGTNFVEFTTLPEPAVDIRQNENKLLITTLHHVLIYDSDLKRINHIESDEISTEISAQFTCATVLGTGLFIGTKENGLFSTNWTAEKPLQYENISPSGPTRNSVFALNSSTENLWAVYGDYSIYYNPYPLDNFGISRFNESGWLNIPYESVLGAKSITRITINPTNENEVYASSFFSGLLKIKNATTTLPILSLFNQSNSGLETLTFISPTYIDVRINGTAFDKSGNLWVTNSLVKNGLKVLKTNGQWQSYATDKILGNAEGTAFGSMVIDSNGTKWFGTNVDGLIGFNEKNDSFKKITIGTDTGNLPIEDVRALAIDTRNQLWIGTRKGLRILSNVGSFLTEPKLTTSPIIILENNLAQELLYQQFITAIKVDGANNKWIGTVDSGVFLVSGNGQETKYHFTIDNSPLPSNTINDIAINSKTGVVYIATNKGLVSFNSIATGASEDLNSVYVYPNPVRPEYDGTIKIAGLLNKANVKITDIEGNLVFETTSEGGTIEWDTTAFGKHKVASGVYLIFISAEDGIETKVKKVMIIR